MHVVHHDRRMSRLFFEAAGFWDVAEAMAFYTEAAAACRDATRAGRPIVILSDLTAYLPQGGAVSDLHARTVEEIRRMPLTRYVIAADKALNRMRLRRLLLGIEFEIVASRQEAAATLGWTEDYMCRLPSLDRAGVATLTPAVPVPTPAPIRGRAAA